MNYQEAKIALAEHRKEINEIRAKMRELERSREAQKVDDYELSTIEGKVRLSTLFGTKDTLFVIHNMGKGCVYCTLWADGLNGIIDHLADSAAVVLTSPDAPDVQHAFAVERGWRFPIASHQGSDFATDLGYVHEDGFWPGVSVLTKRDGQIFRVNDTEFGPGDDYCALWHFLDLIPNREDWQPKYSYAR